MRESLDLKVDFRATDSLGYLLRRASRTSRQLAEDAFVGEELSFPQWISLVLLRDAVENTAGGLARCVGHDAGAMTRLLDHLEEHGLLRRERSESDRRVVHLVLTDDGHAAVDRLMPRIRHLWDSLLGEFTAAEVLSLTSMLQRLVARLDSVSNGDDL